MPELTCFSMELGEIPPDPEELQRRAELKARGRNRKLFVAKLDQMHQLAMANGAAANRILDKHEDFATIITGPTLRELLPVYGEDWEPSNKHAQLQNHGSSTDLANNQFGPAQLQFPASIDVLGDSVRHKDRISSEHQPIRHEQIVYNDPEPIQCIQSDSSYTSHAHKYSKPESRVSSSKSKKSFEDEDLYLPDVQDKTPSCPLPLTMAEVAAKNTTKDAKCLSTLWVNYMKLGNKNLLYT